MSGDPDTGFGPRAITAVVGGMESDRGAQWLAALRRRASCVPTDGKRRICVNSVIARFFSDRSRKSERMPKQLSLVIDLYAPNPKQRSQLDDDGWLSYRVGGDRIMFPHQIGLPSLSVNGPWLREPDGVYHRHPHFWVVSSSGRGFQG